MPATIIAGFRTNFLLIKMWGRDEFELQGKRMMPKKGLFGTKDVTQKEKIMLTKANIKSHIANAELCGEDNSVGGTVARGLAGAVLLGPIGFLSGIAGDSGSKRVQLTWTNGERSLLELNGDDYNTLVKMMF